MNETTLKEKVMGWLRAQPECWAFKVHGGPYQQAGLPDIVGCWAGRFFAIELKVNDNKATRLQAATIEKIRLTGGIAAVCRDVEEVKAIFETLRNTSTDTAWQSFKAKVFDCVGIESGLRSA